MNRLPCLEARFLSASANHRKSGRKCIAWRQPITSLLPTAHPHACIISATLVLAAFVHAYQRLTDVKIYYRVATRDLRLPMKSPRTKPRAYQRW